MQDNSKSKKMSYPKITRREFIRNSTLAAVGSQVLVCPVVSLAKASYNFAFWRAYDLRVDQVFTQVIADIGNNSEVDTDQVFAQVIADIGNDSEVNTDQVFVQVLAVL